MAGILITGASGLIGTVLSAALRAEGHRVHHLSRNADPGSPVPTFLWDMRKGTIDPACLEGMTHIVHLAGAGIADRRWTKARVQELIDSRTGSARLLRRLVQEKGHAITAFISSAGINYYGARTTDHVFVETDAPGSDTIAHISTEWEAAVDEWMLYTRVVKLRTPIVLARQGGALPKLAMPVKLGLGAALGTGHQWMPWVHIDDLVATYQHALHSTGMTGAYNVNAGADVTNVEFMRTVARVLHRPFFMPRIPGALIKAVLGELAHPILYGSKASNARLLATGFQFRYGELKPALEDLLG